MSRHPPASLERGGTNFLFLFSTWFLFLERAQTSYEDGSGDGLEKVSSSCFAGSELQGGRKVAKHPKMKSGLHKKCVKISRYKIPVSEFTTL